MRNFSKQNVEEQKFITFSASRTNFENFVETTQFVAKFQIRLIESLHKNSINLIRYTNYLEFAGS